MELLIPRLGLALAIGLLVGLERGWRERDAPAGSRTAGIRTYGIAGLLGGIFGILADEQGNAFAFAAGFWDSHSVFRGSSCVRRAMTMISVSPAWLRRSASLPSAGLR